jgi:hypothetical protein
MLAKWGQQSEVAHGPIFFKFHPGVKYFAKKVKFLKYEISFPLTTFVPVRG